MGLTWSQYLILVNIVVGIEKGKIKTPIFLRDFAEIVAKGGRKDRSFKETRCFLLREGLIHEEDADFRRKKIVFIDKKGIIKIIRSSIYFKKNGEFIEHTVFGHIY